MLLKKKPAVRTAAGLESLRKVARQTSAWRDEWKLCSRRIAESNIKRKDLKVRVRKHKLVLSWRVQARKKANERENIAGCAAKLAGGKAKGKKKRTEAGKILPDVPWN